MKKKMYAWLLMAALILALCLSACTKQEDAASDEPAAAEEETNENVSADEEDKNDGEPADAVENESEDDSADSSETEEENAEEPSIDGTPYGYAGTDPVEASAYKYMAEEVSKNFDPADASIPTVNIVAVDYTGEDEIIVYGDFWVDNYTIDGDTLMSVSGGHFPGVMHLDKNTYAVTKMDMTAHGAGFDESAKELFGEHYEDFMKVYSDSDAHDELRKITVSDYVNLNGLEVTQYQDYGWDPVELYH